MILFWGAVIGVIAVIAFIVIDAMLAQQRVTDALARVPRAANGVVEADPDGVYDYEQQAAIRYGILDKIAAEFDSSRHHHSIVIDGNWGEHNYLMAVASITREDVIARLSKAVPGIAITPAGKRMDSGDILAAVAPTIAAVPPSLDELGVPGSNAFAIPQASGVEATNFSQRYGNARIELPSLLVRVGALVSCERVAFDQQRFLQVLVTTNCINDEKMEFVYKLPGDGVQVSYDVKGIVSMRSLTARTIEMIDPTEIVVVRVYMSPYALHCSIESASTIYLFSDREGVLAGQCDDQHITMWGLGAQLLTDTPTILMDELGEAWYDDVLCRSYLIGDKIVHHFEAPRV